ncbi:helix-turn-helix domain-containing protein [Streptomyces tibetensis]|uniref:helix-turn-helix domain-containing protein n=1 Tax=Streptomyces tibetensis TaxID=2382123 RepID=UPI0033DFE037
MARPSKKLPDQSDLPCVMLAADLRSLRERSGLTMAHLSDLSALSVGTLSSAQSGTKVPTEKTVTAFVQACGELDVTPWLARREAATRGALPRAVPSTGHAHTHDGPDPCLAWRGTWARWDTTGKLTPPSKAAGLKALPHWLSGLRAYRSVSFRAMARATGYSHTTLAAMTSGFQPVTVRGLLAFLQGCRVGTIAEKIEWLDLLERTSTSPRRRLDAARERARLTALSAGPDRGTAGPGNTAAVNRSVHAQWAKPPRSAWPRQRAVQVDRHLLITDLRALHRFYGRPFLPLLARHAGIASKALRGYLDGDMILSTGHMNRLAAALVRIGSTPPALEQLPYVLPPMADWHTRRDRLVRAGR